MLGDIDYRDHVFSKWEDKVNWEVIAIHNAIITLMIVVDNMGKGGK